MCLLAEIRYQQEFMFSEVHEEEVSVYCFHSPNYSFCFSFDAS